MYSQIAGAVVVFVAYVEVPTLNSKAATYAFVISRETYFRLNNMKIFPPMFSQVRLSLVKLFIMETM